MLPVLAGKWAVDTGKELWEYNRTVFKFDQDQRLKRDFAALDYRIKQFELYREDVRDLVELTVGRMDIYQMVAAMLIHFIVVLIAEGRVEIEEEGVTVPHWFLEVYYLSLGAAFIFLLLAIWLAMHASVAAQSFGTRMLTRFIRLPIPNADALNKARSKLGQFERGGIHNVFRLPFLMKHQTWRGDAQGAGNADKMTEAQHKRGLTATQEKVRAGSKEKVTVIPGVPADPSSSSPYFDNPDNNMPGAECDPRNIIDGHIQLYRKLQGRWQCFDAYSRCSMALGFNQVIHAMATFIIMHLCFEQFAPWSAFLSILPLQVVSLVLLNLDIKEAKLYEFYAAIGGSFVAPWCVLLSVILFRLGYHHLLYQLFVVINFCCHAFWLFVARGFAQPEEIDGISLPFRFRSVLYLDVFADAVKHKKTPGKPGEARAHALLDLQKAMDDAISGSVQPFPAMTNLKKASEACMDLVNPGEDEELHKMVLKAAFMFEEQKLRSEENNVRRCFKRWNNDGVQDQLSEYVKGHIRTLEEQFELCIVELVNSVSQPQIMGGKSKRHYSLLSTGSVGLMEIEYDTGYEQTTYFYNRHTHEVTWEQDEGVEDRKREGVEHIAAKVAAFKESVDSFIELSNNYQFDDDASTISVATYVQPSEWDLMNKNKHAVVDSRTETGSAAGFDDRSRLIGNVIKDTPLQKVYKAVSLAPSTDYNVDRSFKPTIGEYDATKHPTYNLDKEMKKETSFVPGSSERETALRRNNTKSVSFVGQSAFVPTSNLIDTVSPPERLPWGCVRGTLNSFMAMWIGAAILGFIDVFIPQSVWPWADEFIEHGDCTINHDVNLAKSDIAYDYPTPHFETTFLRCSHYGVEAENRFGTSWEIKGSQWERVASPQMGEGVLIIGSETYHLDKNAQKPFAVSNNTIAAFNGKDRVVIYTLNSGKPNGILGIPVKEPPMNMDINMGELVLIDRNHTISRYSEHDGLLIDKEKIPGAVAACKETHDTMLVAGPDAIKRIDIFGTEGIGDVHR